MASSHPEGNAGVGYKILDTVVTVLGGTYIEYTLFSGL